MQAREEVPRSAAPATWRGPRPRRSAAPGGAQEEEDLEPERRRRRNTAPRRTWRRIAVAGAMATSLGPGRQRLTVVSGRPRGLSSALSRCLPACHSERPDALACFSWARPCRLPSSGDRPLQRHEIVDLIGRGNGHGLPRARRVLRDRVAVKPAPRPLATAGDDPPLRSEMSLARKVRHPTSAGLRGGRGARPLFLAMELLEGAT